MSRHIGIWFVLSLLTVRGLAADTNQVAQPTAAQLWQNSFSSQVLPTSAWTPALSTNQPPWSGSASLGMTLTRGNSDTLMANATFGAHRNSLTNEWTFGVDGTYGEAEGIENAEILHGFGQYNHLFTGRVYGYGRAEAWHDGIADVDYRVALSPGVGYYFIKTRQTLLAAGVGPGEVSQKVDDESEQYTTQRLAERFEHKFNPQAHFWNYAELLPQVDKPDNFLVNAEVGVEAAITKKLSLRTVLQDNYANIPAPGRKDNDVKLISGLAYKF